MLTPVTSCIVAGQDYTSLTPTFDPQVTRTLSKVAPPCNVVYIVTMENRVTYGRLSSAARATIQDYGWGVAEYIRHWYPDGAWGGDRCGCPDDRCRDGYHHDSHEECKCLPSVLQMENR